jgi:bile acid:Na+ symporter, BASS family
MFEHYPAYEIWFARTQLILFMLGLGVHLRVADFVDVLRRPRSFLLGFIGHVAVIPLVAVALNHLFALEPRFALGLIVVSAMPGGGMSKVFVFLGRGNAALSITLTALSTFATLVTVPAILHLLAADYVPADFTMPVTEIVIDVLVFLIAPLVAGMALNRIVPEQCRAIGRWAVRIGFVAVAGMIVGALGSGRIRPGEYGLLVPIPIILLCLIGQQLNMVPFYVFNLPRSDRLAVGIEVTMRNMNLALLLNTSLFADNVDLYGGVLYVVLFYAATAMICGFPLAMNHRRLWQREDAAAATV